MAHPDDLSVAPPELAPLVARALREESGRFSRLVGPSGRVYWLKRVEKVTPRMRVQKGDGATLFERERAALHMLREAGLPVAPIIAEGPGYFVTPDLGPTLRTLVAEAEPARDERLRAFAGAGAALARIHAAGFVHGRPAIKDICWDGTAAHYLDFERRRPDQADMRARVYDLLIFFHSTFSADPHARDEAAEAARAYRAAAPAANWDALQRRVARLRWMIPAAAPISRLRPKAREFVAVPHVLNFLRDA